MASLLGCVMAVGYFLGSLWVLYNAWMISAVIYEDIFPYASEDGFWAFAFRVLTTGIVAYLMALLISLLTAIPQLVGSLFSGRR